MYKKTLKSLSSLEQGCFSNYEILIENIEINAIGLLGDNKDIPK